MTDMSKPTEEPFAPLAGVRVRDLTRVLSGPFATMLLGDLGADVVKVERPGTGDETRTVVRYAGRRPEDEDYFYVANRNKRSLALDFSDPDDLNVVRRLAARADVVVENFRPGVMARFGLDAEQIRAENPNVIYCSVSGFGRDGSLRERPSYDGIIQALSGVMSLTGEPGGSPVRAGIMVGDLAGGLFAVVCALAGLEYRRRTGRGVHVDLALVESLMSLLTVHAAEYLATGRGAPAYGRAQPQPRPRRRVSHWGRAVRAAHGFHGPAVGAPVRRTRHPRPGRGPPLRHGAGALGSPPGPRAPPRGGARGLDPRRPRGPPRGGGVPCAPILDVGEALTNEHVTARGFLTQLDHPASGPVRQLAFPARFDGRRPPMRRPPPQLDEDRHDVLRDWLEER